MSALRIFAVGATVVVVHGNGDGEENDRVQRRDVNAESGGAPVVARDRDH